MDVLPPAVDAATRAAARAALFRAVADGETHAVSDLARLAPDSELQDAIAWVVAELAAFGTPIRSDAKDVRCARCMPLDRSAIVRWLDAEDEVRDWEVRVVFAAGSTNSDLLRDVRRDRDAARPRLLVAESQPAGRGRLGRGWHSIAGQSLTASYAVHVDRILSHLDGVTLVCGLAVHGVVTSDRPGAKLKWPNDILVDGRKLAGILVEAHPTRSGTTLVVGVGINVGPSVSANAGSLQIACLSDDASTPVDRNRLAARIARSLASHLALFETAGFAAFTTRWNAVDAHAGRHVALHGAGDATTTGIARGVDDSGALLLDVAGERTRVIAGDVSLRPARHEAGVEAA